MMTKKRRRASDLLGSEERRIAERQLVELGADAAHELRQKVISMDLHWFLQKHSLAKARKDLMAHCEQALERKVKVPVLAVRLVAEQSCLYWRKLRRRGESIETRLTGDQWNQLRAAAEKVRELLIDRTPSQAIAITCSACRCNAQTLGGLPRRLHYWEIKRAAETEKNNAT